MFKNLHSVTNAEGTEIVMNRNAEISLLDDLGRERERFKVNYGAQLLVKEGEAVEPGYHSCRLGCLYHPHCR